ncbi:MAG: right-handed parallel beta-helix repeat-containing protein [Chloroflexota bacterium]|nr:right-handed parallel beta-helix repeat-containing protein [Chloroflexota bacterium]
MRLKDDCTTDETIPILQGFKLDGNGHTITALAPESGEFEGAVIVNEGTVARVRELKITTGDLESEGCDGSLSGINFDGASGGIRKVKIDRIRRPAELDCQDGAAIVVEDRVGVGTFKINIVNNELTRYQKTGIEVYDPTVKVEIKRNKIKGAGPTDQIVQNGIQVSFGARAVIEKNVIRNNNYTENETKACGIIIFQTANVTLGKQDRRNTFSGNNQNICRPGGGSNSLGAERLVR